MANQWRAFELFKALVAGWILIQDTNSEDSCRLGQWKVLCLELFPMIGKKSTPPVKVGSNNWYEEPPLRIVTNEGW